MNIAYSDESGYTGLSKKSSRNFVLATIISRDENISTIISRELRNSKAPRDFRASRKPTTWGLTY